MLFRRKWDQRLNNTHCKICTLLLFQRRVIICTMYWMFSTVHHLFLDGQDFPQSKKQGERHDGVKTTQRHMASYYSTPFDQVLGSRWCSCFIYMFCFFIKLPVMGRRPTGVNKAVGKQCVPCRSSLALWLNLDSVLWCIFVR